MGGHYNNVHSRGKSSRILCIITTTTTYIMQQMKQFNQRSALRVHLSLSEKTLSLKREVEDFSQICESNFSQKSISEKKESVGYW